MDFSKYGLQPEQIIELENTYKQEIEKIKAKVKEPFSDYDSLKSTIQELQSADKKTKKEMANLQGLNEALNKKLNDSVLDNAIAKAFFEKGVKDVDLFGSQIDKTKITTNENGEFIGLNEQLDSVLTKYAHLLEPRNELKGRSPKLNADNKPIPDMKSFLQQPNFSLEELNSYLDQVEPRL